MRGQYMNLQVILWSLIKKRLQFHMIVLAINYTYAITLSSFYYSLFKVPSNPDVIEL